MVESLRIFFLAQMFELYVHNFCTNLCQRMCHSFALRDGSRFSQMGPSESGPSGHFRNLSPTVEPDTRYPPAGVIPAWISKRSSFGQPDTWAIHQSNRSLVRSPRSTRL